jgi:tRNA(adenine34) deaminase
MDSVRYEHYMLLALKEAEVAFHCGEFPVGCVMAGPDGVVATGGRANSTGRSNEMDHAEIVALRSLLAGDFDGDISQIIVYSTMEPCLMCFSTLILNGIRTIVYGYEDVMGGGTNIRLEDLNPLYAAMKITVIPGVLRPQCLSLFKAFFSHPDTPYWRDSLLAKYTLAQNSDGGGGTAPQCLRIVK